MNIILIIGEKGQNYDGYEVYVFMIYDTILYNIY